MNMSSSQRLVPYNLLSPGYEAIYTSRKARAEPQSTEGPCLIEADDEGNEVMRWSLWSWTGVLLESDWDEDIKHINGMREALWPLSDEARKICLRASS